MAKLSEIKLVDATARDMARALNYAMRESKKTAQVLSGQLNLSGKITARDVIKNMYPKDTFTKSGRLKPENKIHFADEMTKIFKNPKKSEDFTMMDYAKAVIKKITQKK